MDRGEGLCSKAWQQQYYVWLEGVPYMYPQPRPFLGIMISYLSITSQAVFTKQHQFNVNKTTQLRGPLINVHRLNRGQLAVRSRWAVKRKGCSSPCTLPALPTELSLSWCGSHPSLLHLSRCRCPCNPPAPGATLLYFCLSHFSGGPRPSRYASGLVT